jgi:hypothetical protein
MPSAAQVVSLVTFFGPAKKVTRLPAGTGELDLRPLATETLIVPNQLPHQVRRECPAASYFSCLSRKSKQKNDTPRYRACCADSRCRTAVRRPGKNSAGASDICPAASAFSRPSPARPLLGKKFKNRDSQITAETGSAFKTPEAFFASATNRVSDELRMASGVETRRKRFLFNRRTKEIPHYANACPAQRRSFLW